MEESTELFNDISDDEPRKAEFLKKYEDFWAAYRHKLKFEAGY